jgi:ABC-type Mn2+/Zn2+ transport system permease subunit
VTARGTLALALSVAVPVLGLYVVFALLIGPALWCRRGIHLVMAVLLALCACALGLLARRYSTGPAARVWPWRYASWVGRRR